MCSYHVLNIFGLCASRNVDKANDSSVFLSLKDSEFSEILIERYKYPALFKRARQNFYVTGIFGPRSGPYHIMPQTQQLLGCLAPDTGVEQ